jgi:hypothetical protein
MSMCRRTGLIFRAAASLALVALGATAAAQPCQPAWSAVGSVSTFGTSGVFCLTVFDDGGGPALYLGGQFAQAAGLAGTRGLAKWDGQAWSAVGGGMERSVYATAVSSVGGSPALYVGGNFLAAGGVPANRIARWDGQSWSALGDGVGSRVSAIAEYNGALYVGGYFTTAGGQPASHIAKWDGVTWSALPNDGLQEDVLAFAVYDDGSGPKLYVGGVFVRTADSAVQGLTRIASWDGTSWAAVGGGLSGFTVSCLTVFNGQLIAAGSLGPAGGPNLIYAWNGQYWSSIGDTGYSGVSALSVFDDGTGPALYVGGTLTEAAGVPASKIAKWDGGSWSALGDGITSADTGGYRQVFAMRPFQSGSGNALCVGGMFGSAGNVPGTAQLARWVPCRPTVCCPTDYNGDGDVGTDADIEAFFACLGGNCCATCPPDADFNCDGDVGTDADIEAFFRVLAGGHC